MRSIGFGIIGIALVTVGLGGCSRAEEAAPAAEGAASQAAAPAGPSAGDQEYARLTAQWTPEALEACGPGLRELLGTRDLVQGALDGVKDPAGKATSELEDARHWLQEGDGKLQGVRPKLESGTCDGDIQLAVDEAIQSYVKAGTAAVQAGQMAEG